MRPLPRLLTVGDAMLDVTVDPGAGTHGARVHVGAGGTAVNAALAAARAGAKSLAAGCVGSDEAAAALRAALAAGGAGDALAADLDAPTGTVVRVGGALHVDRGANARLAPAHVPSPDGAAVLVSGFALLHADSAAAGRAALAAGGWTLATGGSPGLAARGGRGAYAGARVLVVNAAEAEALTGARPDDAARELARAHEVACVTLGAEGAVLAAGDALVRAAPPAALVTRRPEVGGAGDAFAAVLLLELASGAPFEAALRAACAAGAAAP
ncbi:MAG TPA: PfkB family carbohydrate kinase [Gaiellaceae bacterium]|nr:PfkB family carbohydrate kinase [Gaiellaceae bacterium]